MNGNFLAWVGYCLPARFLFCNKLSNSAAIDRHNVTWTSQFKQRSVILPLIWYEGTASCAKLT